MKNIDSQKFIEYEVVGNQVDSKERIAVCFNGVGEENNIGIIDEYGNVIVGPIMTGRFNTYCEYEGSGRIVGMYNGYFELYNIIDNEIISTYWNIEGNLVELSEEEKLEIDELKKEAEYTISELNYDQEDSEYFIELQEHVKTKFNIDIYLSKIIKRGKYYTIGFGKQFNSVNIIYDENLKEVGNMIFVDWGVVNGYLIKPLKDSEIGVYVIEELGIVYFNTYGDIIWIKYFDN
jgi:hypothetical protein